MKMPIPQDWDGETWRCVQITFPDSPQWVALLHGALSLYMRGRYWDESTGTITDAQAIGQEIWYRNTPLVDCDGETPNGDGETPNGDLINDILCAMFGAESECEMTGCYIPRGALRVQNGVLQGRDACGEWYDIGAMYSPAEATPEDYTPPEQAEYSGCGKAANLIDLIVAIAQAATDGLSESAVRAAAPGYTLSRLGIYRLLASAQLTLVTVSSATLFDAGRIALMKCKAAAGMADTNQMTQDEREFVVSSIRSALFETLDSNDAIAAFGLYDNAVDALGDADALLAGTIGSTFTNADCTCADPETDETAPVAGGWYLGVANEIPISYTDVTIDSLTGFSETLVHDVYGFAIDIVNPTGGFDRFGRINTPPAGTVVNMTTFSGTDNNHQGDRLYQMADSIALLMVQSLGNDKSKIQSAQALQSAVVGTPSALAGQIAGVGLVAKALAGSSGSGTIRLRWLHNTGSPSHA